jgi:hypothetical protein
MPASFAIRARALILDLRNPRRVLGSITFIVMVGLVPAISRGTLPLLMAGTRPAMTVQAGFIQGVWLTVGSSLQ